MGRVFRDHGGGEEVGEVCGEGLEGFGTLAEAAFAAEGEPLLLLAGEVGGGCSEDGGQRGQVGASVKEGGGEGPVEFAPVEGEGAGEAPDVVKVFHAAVEEAEFDHRFDFFGDEGFAVVGFEGGCGEVEQDGKLDGAWGGGDDVVEAAGGRRRGGWFWGRSQGALEIGSEGGFDAAGAGQVDEGVHAEGEAFAVKAEGFEGGVDADFVALAEGVDDAAFGAVDAEGMAVNRNLLDAPGEDVGYGPVDVNGWIFNARGFASAREGDINGVGNLGGNSVVREGGNHTNDGFWAAFADGKQIRLSGFRLAGKAVESAAEGLNVAKVAHAVEHLGMYACGQSFAGA